MESEIDRKKSSKWKRRELKVLSSLSRDANGSCAKAARRIQRNPGQDGLNSESETITVWCTMIWGALGHVMSHCPPFQTSCCVCALVSLQTGWTLVRLGYSQEYSLGTLLLLDVLDIFVFLLKQRGWGASGGRLQITLGHTWIEQSSMCVFTFALAKPLLYMLIWIMSFKNGILCALSLRMIQTCLFFFLPLQYPTGQVFVKCAWEMLTWMPEICLSANYSIELRY